MSKPIKQSSAVIVVAFMYEDTEVYKKALLKLKKKLGAVEIEGDEFLFSHSDYYKNEMGGNLKKRFVVFSKLQSRGYLLNIKKYTNKLENIFVKENRRLVNIDPGMLTLENFILATNKNFTHRIYIGDNIFADLTLIYQKKKGYTKLKWTYIDYSSEETLNFLNHVRDVFYDKLIYSSPYK